jgi:hypothetical protein
MRKLTSEEIGKFASRSGVKKLAVENFLMSLTGSRDDCVNNLYYDSSLYKWNPATFRAIYDGIKFAFREGS